MEDFFPSDESGNTSCYTRILVLLPRQFVIQVSHPMHVSPRFYKNAAPLPAISSSTHNSNNPHTLSSHNPTILIPHLPPAASLIQPPYLNFNSRIKHHHYVRPPSPSKHFSLPNGHDASESRRSSSTRRPHHLLRNRNRHPHQSSGYAIPGNISTTTGYVNLTASSYLIGELFGTYSADAHSQQ